MRSDMRPAGHCVAAPASVAALMNTATSVVLSPVRAADTGASPKKAPLTTPMAKLATRPTGAA